MTAAPGAAGSTAPAGPTRVLLVEDDPVIGEATALHLERDAYAVRWETDGLDAWGVLSAAAAAGQAYDVLVSDVVLPGLDGVSLTRRVREAGPPLEATPVVLVSARGDALDVVGGLEAGADDYVTKPFEVQVLLARLRSVVRRAARAQAPPATGGDAGAAGARTDVTRVGDLELDRRALVVRRAGVPVACTPTELRLLLELAEHPGELVSRSTLLERVWDHDPWSEDTHLVDVHVQRLRAKIGAERIETVRGFGYRLVG